MTESTPIVHVVDDDLSLRMALGRLLRAAGYDARVYASAGEFLIAPPGHGPACLVLDVRLPGLGGLELQQALETHEQPLPVIFLTGHGDIPMSVQAMRAGAVDFLTKPVKRASLLGAVETALARDAERRAGREKLQVVRDRFETLTARERQVFGYVVAGLLNKQIAAEMHCSIRTVKIHRGRTMEKMKAASLAELVRVAETLRTAEHPGTG